MLGAEIVTVRGGTVLDEDNNAIPGGALTKVVPGCVVEPLGGDELTDVDRNGTRSGIRVYFPTRIQIPSTAILTVEGRTGVYAVTADPDVWLDTDPDLDGPVVQAWKAGG